MKKLFILATLALPVILVSCSKSGSEDNSGSKFKIEAVDIGLSVKWANANIDASASTPHEYGSSYYAWGEIKPIKRIDGWNGYKWYDGDKLTKYNNDASHGIVDNKITLEFSDDVANVKLGGKWRMPTKQDFNKLNATRNNDNYSWQRDNDGWLITYLPTESSIFIPDGDYWSASLDPSWSYESYCIHVNSLGVQSRSESRWVAVAIRAVCD